MKLFRQYGIDTWLREQERKSEFASSFDQNDTPKHNHDRCRAHLETACESLEAASMGLNTLLPEGAAESDIVRQQLARDIQVLHDVMLRLRNIKWHDKTLKSEEWAMKAAELAAR